MMWVRYLCPCAADIKTEAAAKEATSSKKATVLLAACALTKVRIEVPPTTKDEDSAEEVGACQLCSVAADKHMKELRAVNEQLRDATEHRDGLQRKLVDIATHAKELADQLAVATKSSQDAMILREETEQQAHKQAEEQDQR